MIRHIAIKGNGEKGPEIINLLEMMGGKNVEYYTGQDSDKYYFIDNDTKYICMENVYKMENCERGVYILFSFDYFKDDYPWVVGDIVDVIGRECRTGLKVVKMQWGDAYNTMMYCLDCGEDGYGWWRAEDLKYNNDNLNSGVDMNVEFDLSKYSYEVKDGKLIIEEKKPKYPTTYEECCKVLGYDDRETYCVCHTGANERLFESLYRLKICRDAYWKIAGEEMGLGKPWEPNEDSIIAQYGIRPLLFPSKEIYNIFYDNFKDLIEQCKELL